MCLFAFGIRAIISDWSWEELVKDNPEVVAAYIAIACGAFIIIYGLLGFCAVLFRSRTKITLILYAVC